MKNKARKLTGLNKYLGLMFRTRKTKPVYFEFEEEKFIDIHSWFVFFPFRALWFDKNNNVIEEKIMKPFSSYSPKQKAKKLLEIPLR